MLSKLSYNVSKELLQETINYLPSEEFKYTINEPSGNFFYDPWIIKKEFSGTVWEKLLNTLPGDIGEARIIILKPGSCYQSHGDIDDRYHLNISGQYSYIINLETEKLYPLFTDGFWYEMDAGPRHSAANFGNQDRIQLVVRKLLTLNNLIDPVHVKLYYAGSNKYGVRFAFDDKLSPWLNRTNKLSLLSNFTHSHNDVRFNIERSKLEDLKNILPNDFKVEIL